MKIFIMKLWFGACAIFCLYRLTTLVEKRYEVAIVAGDPSKTDPLSILVCRKLSSFEFKKTEIRLEELKNELVNYFDKKKYPSWQSSAKKMIMKRLETGQYLIYKGLLCFLFNGKLERRTKLAIYDHLFPPIYFSFKRSTIDFVQITQFSEYFDQLTVQKKGPPYSNCSESNGRFNFLNECFKNNFRLSRYFYWGNESGTIYLDSSTNRTTEEIEKTCFEKCWIENCEIVQFIPFSKSREPKITRLEGEPKLSKFNFWVQFIGLVCSFANISLNQLASTTIKWASSKVKRRRIRIGLLCLKWAILFLSLTYCGYLYTSMVLEYQVEERNPHRKEITKSFIKLKTVRLAICVNIEEYFISDDNLFDLFFLFDLNDINKTMSEIEKATNGALNDYLEGVYMNYQDRMFRVDKTFEPKVLFRYIEFMHRCFILLISPDYQLMPSNPKLTIKFRKDIFSNPFLYLLTEDENLNENTFEITFRSAFMKRIVRRLKSSGRCVNYRERYGNCTSRQHCAERCINRVALQKFKKIIIHNEVIDKDQFSSEEWNRAYPMDIPNDSRRTYANLSSRCFRKFRDQHPCVEVKFIETIEIVPKDEYTKEFDLFLDVELSIEELFWFNLLFNIMSIHTTFFSMTVLRLLKILYSFIKPKMRNEKIAQFLIYLLCSIGFTWHTYRILSQSINGELTYNQDYEIVKRVRMPAIVFCLPVEEKLIDRNHQLTGNYMEHLTSYLNTESMFERIAYRDESFEWTPFNLSLVERFFFMRSKCFRIPIDREYDRRQFRFSINRQVLKVNFGKWFLDQEKENKILFFMTKTNETGFSNGLDLPYNRMSRISVEQSELTVKYENRLRFMKRLLSTPYEDDFNNLNGQLPEMNGSEFGFRTLKVPVEEDDFDFELRDDLFDQLFIQTNTETTRNSRYISEYQQNFVFNQLKQVDYSDSHFTVSLSLIKKTQSAINEANLILGLLNVLFWFDVGILDLHPIFIYFYDYLLIWLPICILYYLLNQITRFVLFSHRWFKKFEKPLYIRLNARRLRVPRTRRLMFV